MKLDDIIFNKKQTIAILGLLAELIEDVEDEESLDILEQSAIGPYLDSLSDEALMHYGVLGMKWGVRRATRNRNKLEKQTRKYEKQYHKGKQINNKAFLKTVRRQRKFSYKTNKMITKITKFLNKNADGSMSTSSNWLRRNKYTPEKMEQARSYLETSNILKSDYRDIASRLDSLKLDFIIEK